MKSYNKNSKIKLPPAPDIDEIIKVAINNYDARLKETIEKINNEIEAAVADAYSLKTSVDSVYINDIRDYYKNAGFYITNCDDNNSIEISWKSCIIRALFYEKEYLNKALDALEFKEEDIDTNTMSFTCPHCNCIIHTSDYNLATKMQFYRYVDPNMNYIECQLCHKFIKYPKSDPRFKNL